ncbi:MAG: hypothetical protein JOY57_01770 [Actinobacteria bacterium]|nr:hypothetical protein [Actinomycetota bacterium]
MVMRLLTFLFIATLSLGLIGCGSSKSSSPSSSTTTSCPSSTQGTSGGEGANATGAGANGVTSSTGQTLPGGQEDGSNASTTAPATTGSPC